MGDMGKRLPILILGVFAASVAAAIAACANPDTLTPMCDSNVSEAGILPPNANSCTQFAACYLKDGAPGTAAQCCVSADGGPFVGNDLASCLYGFGDPMCPYLITRNATGTGMNISQTCSLTPDMGGGGGGTGGSGPQDAGGG
jgi:hypothetical protein